MRKFVVIFASELPDMDWDKLIESKSSHKVFSADGTKTFVSYTGNKPYCLYGKMVMTASEVKMMLNDTEGEWHREIG